MRRVATTLRIMRLTLKIFLLLVCFGCAAHAHAQDFEFAYAGLDGDAQQRATVAVELAAGTANGGVDYVGQHAVALSPRIFGTFRVRDWLRLEASVNAASLMVSTDGTVGADRAFVMANPYLGASFLQNEGRVHYGLGFGVAFPVANVQIDFRGNSTFGGLAYGPSATLRGRWDMHLWTPDSLGFAVPFTLTTDIVTHVHVDGDAGLLLLVHVGPLASSASDFVMQLAAALRYDVSDKVDVGARLSGVILATSGGQFQSALEPFVGFHNAHLFSRLGFLMNINAPNGFSLNAGKFWSVRATLGVRF